jgi:nucleoside-diphosphate-sugar epimerase
MRLVEEISEAVASSEETDWSGLRLVHAGTGAEYGPVEGVLKESSDTAPVSLYGRSKLAGTNALSTVRRRTGLRAITARLFTVYGPGEHSGRLLPSLLGAAQSGKDVALTVGQQERDFTFVGDVAEGLMRLALLDGRIPDVVNLATGKLTSVRAFAECAAELIGLKASQLHFGARPSSAGEVRQVPVDTRQLRELLGWVPAVGVGDGIAQTASFEAHCGMVRI